MPASRTEAFDTDLATKIAARCAVIAINSYEEGRVAETVLRMIAQEASSQQQARAGQAPLTKVYFWTITKGLQELAPSGKIGQSLGKQDVFDFLTHIQEAKESAIYIARDMYHFLGSGDPGNIRAIRDTVEALKSTRRTLILLNPDLMLHSDLIKDVELMSYPLPDEAALGEILLTAGSSLPKSVKVSMSGQQDVDDLINALKGLTRNEAESVLAQAVVATGELGPSALPFVMEAKQQIIKRSGVAEFWPAEDASTVGGLKRIRKYVAKRLAGFGAKARQIGLPLPKGILVMGVAGVGKSQLVKTLGGGKLPIIRLNIAALMTSELGGSEGKLRTFFATAEAIAPCVVWIDEIQRALPGDGGGAKETDGGTTQRMMGEILTWMQEQRGSYVVATANNVSSLPPEIMRRFDAIFWVGLPPKSSRFEIFAIHLDRLGLNPGHYDLIALVEATEGYTGAEIEKIVVGAGYAAFDDGVRNLTQADLLEAVEDVIPISRSRAAEVQALIAWGQANALPADEVEIEPITRLGRMGQLAVRG